jgi:hypothetical protein
VEGKSEERAAAIDRAFGLATAFAAVRIRRGIVLSSKQIVGAVIAAVVVAATIGICIYLADQADKAGDTELGRYYGGAGATVMAVAMVVLIAPLILLRPRFVKRQMIPHLARLLEPLQPTRDELVDRVKAARKGDALRVWSYLSPTRLEAEVSKVRIGRPGGLLPTRE